MATSRSIRNRVRRGGAKVFELELNSLLDVLVIILVFLIKNYSTTQSELNYVKDIIIPLSSSVDIAKRGVLIQIDKEHNIYIEQKLKANLKSGWEGDGKDKVVDEMVLRKQEINNQVKQDNEKKLELNSNIVNLVMDESIAYEYIKVIMQISLDAGFEEFKFIVIET